jgi:hypothetical protein
LVGGFLLGVDESHGAFGEIAAIGAMPVVVDFEQDGRRRAGM